MIEQFAAGIERSITDSWAVHQSMQFICYNKIVHEVEINTYKGTVDQELADMDVKEVAV